MIEDILDKEERGNMSPKISPISWRVRKTIKSVTGVLLSEKAKKYHAEISKLINHTGFRNVQKKWVDGILDALVQWYLEFLVKMPTGTGKTVFFSEILNVIKESTIIAVPRVSLISQTLRQLHDTWFSTEQIFSIPSYSYNEDNDHFERDKTNTSKNYLTSILKTIREKKIENFVIVSTYDSLKSLYKDQKILLDELIKLTEIIISDEAHHTTWNLVSEMIDTLVQRDSDDQKLHVLLTATPDRKTISLRNMYYEAVSIRLQECVNDKVLILPSFQWVGKAYLKRNETDQKLTDAQIEQVVGFETKEWKPIHEALFDKYIELKEIHKYLPGAVFCWTIEEAERMKEYAISRGLRAIRATSANWFFDEWVDVDKIEDMIYSNEVDLVMTVSKIAEWFDIRPLRVAIRMNPSRDPVYKTQWNGRIFRVTNDWDHEHIWNALRQQPSFSDVSKTELASLIKKTSENTFIIEPDQWVVVQESTRNRAREPWGTQRGHWWWIQYDTIEELPNSIEELMISWEIDLSYLIEKFPSITMIMKEIVEWLRDMWIDNMHTLLHANIEGVISTLLEKKSTQLNSFQKNKVKLILTMRSLEEVNSFCSIVWWEKLSPKTLNQIANEIFSSVECDQSPAWLIRMYQSMKEISDQAINIKKYLFWSVLYWKNPWDLGFNEFCDFFKIDILEIVEAKKQTRMAFSDVERIKYFTDNSIEIYHQVFDIVNRIAALRDEKLPRYNKTPSALWALRVIDYLLKIMGLPTIVESMIWLLWIDKHNPLDFTISNEVKKLIVRLKEHYFFVLKQEVWNTLESKLELLENLWIEPGQQCIREYVLWEIKKRVNTDTIKDGIDVVRLIRNKMNYDRTTLALLSENDYIEIGKGMLTRPTTADSGGDINYVALQWEDSLVIEIQLWLEAKEEKIIKYKQRKILSDSWIIDWKEFISHPKIHTITGEINDVSRQYWYWYWGMSGQEIVKKFRYVTDKTIFNEIIENSGYSTGIELIKEYDNIYKEYSLYTDFFGIELTVEKLLEYKKINVQWEIDDIINSAIQWMTLQARENPEKYFENKVECMDALRLDPKYNKNEWVLNYILFKKQAIKQNLAKLFPWSYCEIMLSYEAWKNNQAVKNIMGLVIWKNKDSWVLSISEWNDFASFVATDSISSFSSFLKEEYSVSGQLAIKEFLQSKSSSSIWDTIILTLWGKGTVAESINAILVKIAPSIEAIIKEKLTSLWIRTKKEMTVFVTTKLPTLQQTEKSQWNIRFYRYLYGGSSLKPDYVITKEELNKLISKLINASVLNPER